MEQTPLKNKLFTHLLAACAAAGFVFCLLFGGLTYARALEGRAVHTAAAEVTDQMTIGQAFLQEAIRQPDLLVVIGSSELLAENGPYQANHFFQNYPTGFNTFVIARAGLTSLNMAQDVAAMGPELRGKKVVISFTPSMFSPEAVKEGTYPGNFSRLHAQELIFNAPLSWDLKRAIAARMLDFPETLENDPILWFAAKNLSTGSRRQRLLYFAVLPLGKLETWVTRLQDHWEAVNYIWQHPELESAVDRQPSTIDWEATTALAEEETAAHATNNPFGFDNETFTRKYASVKPAAKPGSGDSTFVNRLKVSPEWGDLDLLLRTLREMGAEPLVMSRPYSGLYNDRYGISSKARTTYYKMLKNYTGSYGIPLVDFRSFDDQLYFNRDATSHTSPYGWVYVNQALDAFFHGGSSN